MPTVNSLDIDEIKALQQYKQFFFEMINFNYPNLSYKEIDDAVNYSIVKRAKNTPLKLVNSYKDKEMDSSVLDLLEYVMNSEPIITPSGVMFKKHADEINPIDKMIQGFLVTRKKYKKEMFKYPKGSEQFEKYNLLQLLAKIDANS